MKQPVDVFQTDGNLDRGSEGADGLHVKIGVAEKGTAGELIPISNGNEAVARFGSGALVDSLVRHFAEGGAVCYATCVESDIAGTIGEVSHTGTGSATCTVSGNPNAKKDFKVEILYGGACEIAQFRFSNDGGVTFSEAFTLPASGSAILLSNGVSVTFTGTGDCFAKGDVYSFSTEAPNANSLKFLEAIDKVKEAYDPINCAYKFIHVVGAFDRAFWTSLGVKADEFDEDKIFIFFVTEFRPQGASESADEYFQEMIDEGRLFHHGRVAVVGTRERYGNDDDFKSTAIRLVANLSASKTNIHPGWVEGFPAKTSTEIETWEVLKDYIDSLDMSNIICACHYQNWKGIFIKEAHLMSDKNSDYQFIYELRPADKIRFLAYNKIMPFVNSEAGVEGDESGVDSLAAEIDNAISNAMELPGNSEIGGHETVLNFANDEVFGDILMLAKGTMKRFRIGVGYVKSLGGN